MGWNDTIASAGGEGGKENWEEGLLRLQNMYNILFKKKRLEVNVSEC